MTTISNKVRFYGHTVVGAPVLSGTPGALIALLDACLVNGFGNKVIDSLVVSGGIATANISSGHDFAEGDVLRISGATPAGLNSDWRLASTTASSVTWSVEGCGIADGTATGTITALRAPAGWEKVFSDGTTRAAYRSLTHADHNGMFIYVNDTSGKVGRVRGYESMSSIDVGVDPFPLDGQISGGLFWGKSDALTTQARRWYLVADSKRFVFAPSGYGFNNSDYFSTFFFGKLRHQDNNLYNTVIGGCASESNALTWVQVASSDYGLFFSIPGMPAVPSTVIARTLEGAKSAACAPSGVAYSNSVSGNAAQYGQPFGVGGDISVSEFTFISRSSPWRFEHSFPGVFFLLNSFPIEVNPSGKIIGVVGNGIALCHSTYQGVTVGLNLGSNGEWD